MSPKLLPISTDHKEIGPQVKKVRRWFQKFRNGGESLKEEESRGRSCNPDNEQLQENVEQNPRQSVKEISQTLVSNATVSKH